MAANIDMIQKVYSELGNKINKAREIVARPLTYTDKILYAHLIELPEIPMGKRHEFRRYWEMSRWPKEAQLLADLVRAVMPKNWKEDPAWVRLAEALGKTDGR